MSERCSLTWFCKNVMHYRLTSSISFSILIRSSSRKNISSVLASPSRSIIAAALSLGFDPTTVSLISIFIAKASCKSDFLRGR